MFQDYLKDSALYQAADTWEIKHNLNPFDASGQLSDRDNDNDGLLHWKFIGLHFNV